MSPQSYSVRIIAGRWRGRRIRFAHHPGIRPTPDRVRETLFNWLRDEVLEARCLDLFAGSGALGFEALSRGAAHVNFVEQSAAAAEAIRANLELLGGAGEVVQADAAHWLARAPVPSRALAPAATARPGVFDLVFLDPPFGKGWLPKMLELLAAGPWLAPDARIYLECERAAGTPLLPVGWHMLRSKFAGEVGYHLARNEQANSGLPGDLRSDHQRPP